MTTGKASGQRLVLPGGRPPKGPDRIVPPGRKAKRTAEVLEIRRARALDAFVILVGERGLARTEIRDVCDLADVPVKAFYELFEGGKATCAAQAFWSGSEVIVGHAQTAYSQTNGLWEAKLYAAVATMLDLLSSNPNFARLAIVEISRDHDGRRHFRDVVWRCRHAFGGPEALRVPHIAGLDASTYETVLVGAALRPLECAVLEGRTADLPGLAAAITYALALPMVGYERAIRQVAAALAGP
jgi:AcrR family transcriptional regulator